MKRLFGVLLITGICALGVIGCGNCDCNNGKNCISVECDKEKGVCHLKKACKCKHCTCKDCPGK